MVKLKTEMDVLKITEHCILFSSINRLTSEVHEIRLF